MTKWIERGLYKLFGWWRWKRRFTSLNTYSLNAFCGTRLRILVSDADKQGHHDLQVERLDRNQQWRRIGTIAENEFAEVMSLLVDAGNFLHPGSLRWKVLPH